jgi:Uma2 family endonuclease
VTVPPPADPYADPPTDVLFEIVNGVRVEKRMSAFEQYIAGLLFTRLERHVESCDLGRAFIECKFTIPGSGNDRQPDTGFLSFTRWPKTRGIPKTNAWPVVPDLVVEVISPTDKGFDILDKLREYFGGGVRAVWHVWSNVEQVHCWDSPTVVRILTRADVLTGDPVVPGFRMPLADLFPPADPTP